MRTIVIGDIHSGLKALEQLIARIELRKEDTLIFLGDYVDGWSEAVETVRFLIELQKQYHCIFLKGNHDELVYNWLMDGVENPMWLAHGGEASKMSYTGQPLEVLDAHKRFYQELENYYIDNNNRLFVHAGFTHLKGVAHEYFTKSFYWDRTLWELALSLHSSIDTDHEYYPSRLKNYSEIFIGHTPVTRINKDKPFLAANVWNLDTGAAFKGTISALDVDSKKLWQSDPVHLFYPNEKGRN